MSLEQNISKHFSSLLWLGGGCIRNFISYNISIWSNQSEENLVLHYTMWMEYGVISELFYLICIFFYQFHCIENNNFIMFYMFKLMVEQ
jgi:hypothetical protein